MEITKLQKKKLIVQSQSLKPVVMLGQHGCTEAVLKEIDSALTTHELIKVRVSAEDREARQIITDKICEATKSVLIHKIGHVISIYRKNPVSKKVKVIRKGHE